MSTLDPQGSPSGTGARIVGTGVGDGPGPDVMAADTLDGTKVVTSDGEDVGKISDIMLDVRAGRIAYAVLSEGGFLGMGTTLHAMPWSALTLDTDAKCFRVDITAQQLKVSGEISAHGFLRLDRAAYVHLIDRWTYDAESLRSLEA